MRLSDEQVKKYQKIYEQEFNKTINYDQAYGECLKMILVIKLLFHPITEKDLKGLQD